MLSLKTTITTGLVLYGILLVISGILMFTYLIIGGQAKDIKKKSDAKRSMLISLATFLTMIFVPLVVMLVLPPNLKENLQSIMASP
jgi:uncharacterized membrane-anchored protein